MKCLKWFVAALLCIFVSAQISSAQTVESVLCALQERKAAIVLKDVVGNEMNREADIVAGRASDYSGITFPEERLIQWRGLNAKFPAAGSVDTMEKLLNVLNQASLEFDEIKGSYLAFGNDPVNEACVEKIKQSDGSPLILARKLKAAHVYMSSIRLPSVGVFTEANWRGKLRVLASNIDQLKVLRWGAVGAAYRRLDAKTYSGVRNQWCKPESLNLFPWGMIGLGLGDVDREDLGTPVDVEWSEDGGGPFTWQGIGGFSGGSADTVGWGKLGAVSEGPYKLKTRGKLLHISAPNNVGNLGGRLTVLRAPVVNGWGDLMESTASTNPTGNLGSMAILESATDNLLRDGNLGPPAGVDKDGNSYVTSEQCRGAAMRFLGITQVAGIAAWANANYSAGLPGKQIIDSYSNAVLDVSPNPHFRKGYIEVNGEILAAAHELAAECYVVFEPAFTSFAQSGAKLDGAAPYSIGGLDTHLGGDPYRIGVGRGNTDANQAGWLTGRADGFGTMTFLGSPRDFEVLYERDRDRYIDEPLGGKKFDSELEFINETAGWKSRFEYIAAWHSPRLRQVKGQDVLVDIAYGPGPYKRKLDFYWATDANIGENGFYTFTVAPFKTVVVRNPTASADGSGLPSKAKNIRIEEDAARFTDIRNVESFDNDGMLTSEVITIMQGGSPGGSELSRVIEIPWNSGNVDGVITESINNNGVESTVTSSYAKGFSPRETENPVLLSVSTNIDEETRTWTYTWTSGAAASKKRSDYVLSQVIGSVPEGAAASSTWADKGTEFHFSNPGIMSLEKRTIAGKAFETSHTLVGNVATTTTKIGDESLPSVTATYSDSLDQVTIANNGAETVTLKYNGPSGGNPRMLKEANYPGGYRESFSRTTSGDFMTSSVTSGWNEGVSSPVTIAVVTDRLGGVVSHSVVDSGVVLDSATGSDFTGWGAPNTITNLRGDTETRTYYQSGLEAGSVATATNSYRITSGISYDWLMRPAGVDTGFDEHFAFNYSDPLKVTIDSGVGGHVEEFTGTAFGEFRKATSTFGVGSEVNFNPGGAGSLKVDGRTVPVTASVDGIVSKIGNGLGSRGANFDFGVANGQFYTESTELKKEDGTAGGKVVRTYFDAKGRPVTRSHPGGDNAVVTDSWNYNDADRTVTYTPGAGPLAQSTTSVLSADGTTLTVSENGAERLRYRREVSNGALVRITEQKDDSTNASSQVGWTEVSREAVNPAAGTVTSRPFGLESQAVTLTEPVPGAEETPEDPGKVTLSGAGDTLSITLSGGLPSGISGTVNGVAVEISSISYTKGRFSGYSGTIGGQSVGLTLGADRRLANLWGPGTNQTFQYEGAPGYLVTVTDSVQGTTSKMGTDFVGDLTSLSDGRSLALSAITVDVSDTAGTDTTEGGSRTTINGSVTLETNLSGLLTGKSYTGGISESYPHNGDGSAKGFTIEQSAGSVSATITQTPTQRTSAYNDGTTITENFYNAGPRKDVAAPNDERTFAYERLALRTETHTAGPWAGWTVEREPDLNGRLGTLRVTGAGLTRETSFGYDTYSRLNSSTTQQLSAGYGARGALGQLTSLTRGTLTTGWSYDTLGRLDGVSNTGGQTAFGYSYPQRDSRHRIITRQASAGVSWTNLDYDTIDQLKGANVGNGRTLAYGYDGRGNRDAQGAAVAQVLNGLDQVTSRTHAQRGFGVTGSVNPQASLKVFHPLNTPAGETLTVHPQTGSFFGYWSLPDNWNGGATGRVDALLRGTLTGAGMNGTNAVAEKEFHLMAPPVTEAPVFDAAGRLKQNAFFIFNWDAAGRLTSMERKPEALPEPNLTSDVVGFTYDADGRRTKKERTRIYQSGQRLVEESRVLWSGWLPLMEERSRNGNLQGRRFFQWGADLGGGLEQPVGLALIGRRFSRCLAKMRGSTNGRVLA